MKITITSLMSAMYAMAENQHSHYISLMGPGEPCNDAPQNHLMLRFHDIECEAPGYTAPSREDIKQLIAYAKALPEGFDLLVHCYAGISRSTAAAVGIACALGMAPADALQHIRSIREPTLKKGYMVLPNRRIIGFFDEELGLNGELNRVVEEYYSGLPLIGVSTLPNRGGWNTVD